MASRKKAVSLSLGLGLPPSTSVATPTVPVVVRHEPAADLGRSEPVDLEEMDDYDDEKKHNDVPRFRLVDPPTAIVAIEVEKCERHGFMVSRLGRSGTSWARVMFTRAELEEFVLRAVVALEAK